MLCFLDMQTECPEKLTVMLKDPEAANSVRIIAEFLLPDLADPHLCCSRPNLVPIGSHRQGCRGLCFWSH